jgi:membrane fusion protein (multidrug efflux system)
MSCMAKKMIFTAVGLLLAVGILVGIKVLQFKTMFAQQAHAAPPPEAVAVSPVRTDTIHPTLEAVGSVTSAQGVTLTAEIAGTVRRIAFDSGTLVKAGDVLVELDSNVEKAQLVATQASAKLARTNLESSRPLISTGAISGNAFITLEAQAAQADADVARLQALVDKKTIRAPFAATAGLRKVNLGQFVGNGTEIVSLQALDPVYVDFTLPQQRLADVRVGVPIQVTTDVFPDAISDGKLTAINPQVDPATRNVGMRATFQNPDGRLRPGMFAHLHVLLPGSEQVLLVPATAVSYAPYGNSVYVVETSKNGQNGTDHVARQKFVRLGAARGDFVVVTKGLSAGENVVITGAFKLRNGEPVMINNELKPEPSDNPKPTDT